MTKVAGDTHDDTSNRKRPENSADVARHYRFDHLSLPLVLRDMYFKADAPRPGDWVIRAERLRG